MGGVYLKNLHFVLLKWINPLFYFIRSNLRFKKGDVAHTFEDKSFLYDKEVSIREKKIRNEYQLSHPYGFMSVLDYKLSLYQLDLLIYCSSFFDFPKGKISAVDVGSKNFFYAFFIHSFLRRNGKIHFFSGVEIDAFRVYDDFHSRYDYALSYIKDLDNTSYLPIDFLNYKQKVNIIFMFLPFVYKEPLLKWGLPIDFYQPEKIMKHAYSLLEEGGVWIITNQGMDEARKQQEILHSLSIPFKDIGEFCSPFYRYPISHFITIVIK